MCFRSAERWLATSHCCVRDPEVAATPQGALREVNDAKAAPSASPRGGVAERYFAQNY